MDRSRRSYRPLKIHGDRQSGHAHELYELERWCCSQLGKSLSGRIEDHRSRLRRALASTPCSVAALYPASGLVPQARGGRLQIGITAAMKPAKDDRLDARGFFSQPRECSAEGLRPPEIVGEVTNPALEAIRRFWWRAFDRVCDCIVLVRLSMHDWIYGPEPPTPADLEREADSERLVTALPVAGEAIERQND
jgi:hypothetical protein